MLPRALPPMSLRRRVRQTARVGDAAMMMNSRAPIAGTTFCGDGGGWAGAFCAGAGMMRWAAPGGPTAAGLERSRGLQPRPPASSG